MESSATQGAEDAKVEAEKYEVFDWLWLSEWQIAHYDDKNTYSDTIRMG